jgi:hypothetical protein
MSSRYFFSLPRQIAGPKDKQDLIRRLGKAIPDLQPHLRWKVIDHGLNVEGIIPKKNEMDFIKDEGLVHLLLEEWGNESPNV